MATSEVRSPKGWREGEVIHDLFEVRGVIGAGSFGTVHRVYHLDWRKELAIKTPSEETAADGSYLSRCVAAARTWADLGVHPNIVTCFYVQELDGVPCIVMECVGGGRLRDRLDGGMDVRDALDFAIQICRGMSFAHEHSVLHGDLRPENCLLTPDAGLKLTGFGLGSTTPSDGRDPGAAPAAEYLSPEFWRGDVACSPAMDMFAFGVVLYEMLMGSGPFPREDGETLDEFRSRVAREGWSYRELAAAIPQNLRSLVGECLSTDAEQRPEGFAVVEERLGEAYRVVCGSHYPRSGADETSLKAVNLIKQGVTFHDLGVKDEALSALEDAVKSDPSRLESSYNHTLLLWEKGKMTDHQVVRWLQMKAESHAGEWRPLYLLGLAHIARKDAESAESALREALSAVSTDGEVVLALEEVEKRKDHWPRFLLGLTGHGGPVNSVAISWDSRFAVSGSVDKTVRHWDLLTGECLHTLSGHERAVNSVAMSPLGGFCLSGSDDRTVRCWDLETGMCLATLRGHERAIQCVVGSPDGSFALSGGADKTLRMWDLKSGECTATLKGHERGVSSIAISSDGAFVLSGSDDKTLRCWDLKTGESLRVMEGHERGVSCAAISGSGRFAVSGSDDKTLRRWDLTTGECTLTLNGHEAEVSAVVITSDERFAISQGRDRTLRIWDLTSGVCLRTIERASRADGSLAVSPDSRFVLSGGDDKALSLWYLGKLEGLRLPLVIEQVQEAETQHAHASDFSVLKERVLECMRLDNWRGAAEYLQRVRAFPGYERHPEVMDLWEEVGLKGVRKALNGCWLKSILRGHDDWVSSVAISPGGKYGLSGSDDGTLRLWEIRSGESVRVFEGHKGRVSSVAISPKGKLALSGGHDGTLRLWSVGTGESLGVISGHTDWVCSVAVSPDGRLALSGSDDGTLRLWDLSTRECLRVIEGTGHGVRSVAFSPDGRFALAGSDDSIPSLWDLRTRGCLHSLEGHESWVTSVAFTPDSRFALSGSLDNTLRLWDIRNGACLKVLVGHDDWIRGLAVSPDGRFALSASHDRTLRLWDLRTGECPCVLRGHEDWASSVVFSPDGRFAISGGHDNAVCLWEYDWAYEFPGELDWAEGATPYLEVFLNLHSYLGPNGLTCEGKPSWTEEDLGQLLHELSLRGYGWLRPAGVQRKLGALASARESIEPGSGTWPPLPQPDSETPGDQFAMHCVCCGRRFPASVLSAAAFCPDCQQYVSRRPEGMDQGSWWKRLTGR